MNRTLRDALRQRTATHVLGLLAGLLCSCGAWAAERPKHVENNFEITPFYGQMGGGRFQDPLDSSDRDVDSNSNWGVFFNVNAESPERQYELLYTQQSTEIEGVEPIDLDVKYLQIGGIVNFTDARHAIPYFGMTVGATQFSPSESGLDDETKISFSAGGGLKIPITNHIGIRFDARAFVTLLDTEGDLFCVSSNGAGTCRIRASSSTFVQYHATLGLIAAF
ncbi:MAG: outer membrane beta-barrel protein [Povalibacter sp.]